MSPYLLIALAIMSLGIMSPFFTSPPGDSLVNATCIFLLSTFLCFLIITLLDISKPFNGFWEIKTDAFGEISTLIEKELINAKAMRKKRMELIKAEVTKKIKASGQNRSPAQSKV